MTDHEKDIELMLVEIADLQAALEEAMKTEESNMAAMSQIIVGTTERIRAMQAEVVFHKDGAEELRNAVAGCQSCKEAVARYDARGL